MPLLSSLLQKNWWCEITVLIADVGKSNLADRSSPVLKRAMEAVGLDVLVLLSLKEN